MPRWVYGALSTAGAVGLLALLVWLAGPQATLDVVARLAAWQAGVLVLTAFGVSAFTALAWRAILARYGHHERVWLLFQLTILAFAAGWAIPSGFVAGIPIAAWFLARRGVPFACGLATFAISRFLEMTAYVLVLPVVLLSDVGARPGVRAVAIVAVAGLVVVYLDVLLGWRLARRAIAAVSGVAPRATHRSIDAVVDFCRTVTHFFRGAPGPVVLATAYSFAAIGVAFVRAVLTDVFLDLHLTIPDLVVMFAITVLLMAVPFLPGAIGAYEGGIAGAFELLGRPKAEGLAYAMTVHATELVVAAAGFAVLAHLGIGLLGRRQPGRRAVRVAGRARAHHRHA